MFVIFSTVGMQRPLRFAVNRQTEPPLNNPLVHVSGLMNN